MPDAPKPDLPLSGEVRPDDPITDPGVEGGVDEPNEGLEEPDEVTDEQ